MFDLCTCLRLAAEGACLFVLSPPHDMSVRHRSKNKKEKEAKKKKKKQYEKKKEKREKNTKKEEKNTKKKCFPDFQNDRLTLANPHTFNGTLRF